MYPARTTPVANSSVGHSMPYPILSDGQQPYPAQSDGKQSYVAQSVGYGKAGHNDGTDIGESQVVDMCAYHIPTNEQLYGDGTTH